MAVLLCIVFFLALPTCVPLIHVGWRGLLVPVSMSKKSGCLFGVLDACLGLGCLWLLPRSSLG